MIVFDDFSLEYRSVFANPSDALERIRGNDLGTNVDCGAAVLDRSLSNKVSPFSAVSRGAAAIEGARQLSAMILEEPVIGDEEGRLLWRKRQIFLRVRVLCHERTPPKRGSSGYKCEEFGWCVLKPYGDFVELYKKLQSEEGMDLPEELCPVQEPFLREEKDCQEFARQNRPQLLRLLQRALDWVTKAAREQPKYFRDPMDVCETLPRFLGMTEVLSPVHYKEGYEGSPLSTWVAPPDADNYPVSVEVGWGRGTSMLGRHPDDTMSLDGGYDLQAFASGSCRTCRIHRHDRTSKLGEMRAKYQADIRVLLDKEDSTANRRTSSMDSTAASGPGSDASLSPSRKRSLDMSSQASGLSSRSASPTRSPAQSPPGTPRGRRASSKFSMSIIEGDDEDSFSRAISNHEDIVCTMTFNVEGESRLEAEDDFQRERRVEAIWHEVEVLKMCEKHNDFCTLWERRIDGGSFAKMESNGSRKIDVDSPEYRQTVEELERKAAIFRDLSAIYPEELHPILGYGYDSTGRALSIVYKAAPTRHGLRNLPFSFQLCYRFLYNALKAIHHMHEQQFAHEWICPESFLVEKNQYSVLSVRLVWAPFYQRVGNAADKGMKADAMTGFRAPGSMKEGKNGAAPHKGMASDMWSLACVILVWWANFKPTPHPWSQFAKSSRLQSDIVEAFSSERPLPQLHLDFHRHAAEVEDNLVFWTRLANLLDRCLAIEPAHRSQARELLRHHFFEHEV
eukprot:TRINITY_DN82004_c0_g1_i1.p1 TRINITY_DN82004_c0_g1~~TRINITY_DN82004_c0_g1_i1.p1  ORF type:complete len:735 (-),score=177.32 TRINITY_DN82004_c0_g1_i1:209-2413(-)